MHFGCKNNLKIRHFAPYLGIYVAIRAKNAIWSGVQDYKNGGFRPPKD